MKAFSGNNLKTITKMININNKNNFTLFIFHWTYEYGNIYFLGDMWKFWKIQRTESLARGMSLVTNICIESLNWNLYGSTYTQCLMFFLFFFKWHLKFYNQTSKTLQTRNISGMLLRYKKKPIRNEKLNHKQEHLLVYGFMAS